MSIQQELPSSWKCGVWGRETQPLKPFSLPHLPCPRQEAEPRIFNLEPTLGLPLTLSDTPLELHMAPLLHPVGGSAGDRMENSFQEDEGVRSPIYNHRSRLCPPTQVFQK